MNELEDTLQLNAPVGNEECQWPSTHSGDEQLIIDMDLSGSGRSSVDRASEEPQESPALSSDVHPFPIIEDDEADSDSASGHLDASIVIEGDVYARTADEPPDYGNRHTSSQSLRSSLKSTSTISTADLSSSNRKISFSSIEIREYNVTLGDSPTVNGPPIQLDWSYNPEAQIYHLDDYEIVRSTQGIRRSKEEMLMTPSQRTDLLMREVGFSRGEIEKGARQARRAAKQRHRTIVTLGRQPIEEALETTKRRWGKLIGKRQA